MRDDTQTEVNYLSFNSFTKQTELYTEDVDMSLRDQTLVFRLLVTASDGQVDVEAARLTIEFTGVNNEPYFDPFLPGVIQIFKQVEPL